MTSAFEAQARRLCHLVAGFYARGWCLGTSGNYSFRLPGDPLRLAITPSGAHKGELAPGDLLVIDEEGRKLEGGPGKPSAETLLHTTLASRLGAGAILHTHSVAGTLLSEHFLPRGSLRLAGYEMLKGLPGVETHEAAVEIPILANSQDMPALSAELSARIDAQPAMAAFLLAGHGLYTWGESLDDARRQIEVLEFLFEVAARRVLFRPLEAL